MKNKETKTRGNKVLAKRIDLFNEAIEYMRESDMVREAKKEVRKLSAIYKPVTVRGYLTIYRARLKTTNVKVNNALRINNKVQNKIEKDANRKISKQQSSLIIVRNIDTMLETALLLLDSDKYAEIVASLCLLTGRRASEILKTAKFTNSKNSKKVMYFEGQLKTDNSRKYEIPVLMNSRNECKKALKRLRSMIDTTKMSVFEAGRAYNNQVNEAVKSWFTSHIGKCSSHDMRKVYSAYCDVYINDRNKATNKYLSEILGHSLDDISVSNRYQKYKFK